jgi:hypothetical protein
MFDLVPFRWNGRLADSRFGMRNIEKVILALVTASIPTRIQPMNLNSLTGELKWRARVVCRKTGCSIALRSGNSRNISIAGTNPVGDARYEQLRA